MEFDIDGHRAFASTGERPFAPNKGALVLLHGAGMDHTVWSFQARRFAHRGMAVFAPDFPGHGRSGGPPRASIESLADWTIGALRALGLDRPLLVGHSMGARVALEVAARLGPRAGGLVLVGIAERLAVNPELRRAAAAGEDRAVDMILKWSFGGRPADRHWRAARLARRVRRLMARTPPAVLGVDLAACDEDKGAVDAAGKVACPAAVVAGAGDRMTPPASARRLAEKIAGAALIEIPDAGHMSPIEAPAAVAAAIARIA
ncbi:MAG: alpha/beta hydrolase [Alphaproteobacteria bacterium]|nr:alpha/beta hydrolase [Alphaproteobacteria bacterium]